jgi:hypothetical protein
VFTEILNHRNIALQRIIAGTFIIQCSRRSAIPKLKKNDISVILPLRYGVILNKTLFNMKCYETPNYFINYPARKSSYSRVITMHAVMSHVSQFRKLLVIIKSQLHFLILQSRPNKLVYEIPRVSKSKIAALLEQRPSYETRLCALNLTTRNTNMAACELVS